MRKRRNADCCVSSFFNFSGFEEAGNRIILSDRVILSAVFQRYVPAEFVAGLFGDNRGFGVLMAALLILLMAYTLVGEKCTNGWA